MSDGEAPPATASGNVMDPTLNEGKVFIGGLAPTTTDDTLRGFMAQFGAVKEASVMMTQDWAKGGKRSRGFGFVVFEDASVIDNVIGTPNLELDGKHIEVKRVDEKRGEKGAYQAVQSEEDKKKVFCGGLPDGITDESLKEYFSKYDPDIVGAKIMINAADGRSRGFAYVEFSSAEIVQQVLGAKAEHTLNGKWIEVKECMPQVKGGKKGKKGDKGKGKGYDPYGGYGKGYGGYAGAGKGYGAYPAYAPAPGYEAYGYAAAAPAYGYAAAAPAYGYAAAAPAYGYAAAAPAYGYAVDPNAAAAAAPQGYAAAPPANGYAAAAPAPGGYAAAPRAAPY